MKPSARNPNYRFSSRAVREQTSRFFAAPLRYYRPLGQAVARQNEQFIPLCDKNPMDDGPEPRKSAFWREYLPLGGKLFYHRANWYGVCVIMNTVEDIAPEDIAPSLDSLKLALGRLERATSRVEIAIRAGASAAPANAMTSDTLKALESGLESAIGRIDGILKDAGHG